MALKLTKIVPPPKAPFESGSAKEWTQLQKKLGTKLPDDFKEYGKKYGSGSFGYSVHVYQPFSQEFLEMVNFHSCNLEAFKVGEGADYVPYEVFPPKSGLLVWGGDSNGNELYWKTVGEPNEWSIVVRSRDNEYQEFPGPFTEFLADALTRKIDVQVWSECEFPSPSDFQFLPRAPLPPKPADPSEWPTSIYVLYTKNNSRAGFWARKETDYPEWSYFIKSIAGMIAGPLTGVPEEYDHQAVIGDVYRGDRLQEVDIEITGARQSNYVRADPARPELGSCAPRVEPTSIYELYSKNGNRADFWVQATNGRAGVSYLIKSIGGITAGPLIGVPKEYERQIVMADEYQQDWLLEGDRTMTRAHQPIFVRVEPPQSELLPFLSAVEPTESTTSIYVLYTKNDNQADFWVKSATSEPDVTYLIKSIGGMTAGPLTGDPDEYDRQHVTADKYQRGQLVDSDLSIGNAHRPVFCRVEAAR